MDKLIDETALKIIGMSDRGQLTLTFIELALREMVAKGRAMQQAADKAKQRGQG